MMPDDEAEEDLTTGVVPSLSEPPKPKPPKLESAPAADVKQGVAAQDAEADPGEGVVPTLLPPPEIKRGFVPAPWHRPRKQYIRTKQWNHELVEQVIRARRDEEGIVRVFGLPSADYLDLLSMRDLCEAHDYVVSYLGFNYGHEGATRDGAVDLYAELGIRSVMDASSFVHTNSTLVADRFERIRSAKSMSRKALNSFIHFDVVNLDICGCVGSEKETIDAMATLLSWQSTRRLDPWLFYVTTNANKAEVNLEQCSALAEAIVAAAAKCEGFEQELQQKTGMTSAQVLDIFKARAAILGQDEFLRLFGLVVGEWVSAQLQKPVPPANVTMLPSYIFRHDKRAEPEMLSLAYLITPKPSEEKQDPLAAFCRHAKKLIAKSYEVKDLDGILEQDATLRNAMADQTVALLVQQGFDTKAVEAFMQQYR